ncbi:MAG: cupredoxin domain-containing protein [Bacillota bacterium]
MKKLLMLVLVALMSLGILTACGGGGGGGATKEITVEMGANGEWKFKPDRVEVNKGDNVKVTLVNKDPAQPHTFVVPALNVKSQQVAANQTSTVTFTANTVGEHDLICDVPGHKDAGMVGKLIVK